jgi:hypothetical protein
MKIKSVFLTAILAAVLCISGNLWAAGYSGGSGTAADPYKISTAADLQWLTGHTTDWGKHFILTGNLDLTGVSLSPIGLEDIITGSPVPFTGVFDGQDYTLSNVVIHRPGVNFVGLFGYVTGGTISNLGLVDVTVSGHNYIGGLVGKNDGGSITACYATGTVSGDTTIAGGLVGQNITSGTITACHFRGNVSGGYCVGGLVGMNTSSTIAASYAFAEVIGGDSCIGGLVGQNWSGSILSCYAIGDTSGTSSVGGLVGDLGGGGSITSSYAASAVSPTGPDIGGLVGTIPNGTVDVSFWDMQASGQETSAGGEGKTTNEMWYDELYLHAGWDFIGEENNGVDDIWMITNGDSYPVFTWRMKPGNDLMAQATGLFLEIAQEGTSIGAAGQDITLNGYNDWADVWYYFDSPLKDQFTITLIGHKFDTTLAVFDAKGHEVAFNDDFFGGKSVVILKARAGVRYYIRVSGCDSQRGGFEISLKRGAVQAIQGDLNYDGHVNLTDFAIFADNWLGEM